MGAFFRKHRTDIFIFIGVLSAALLGLIPFLAMKASASGGLIASIYHQSELLMKIDLSQENEERIFEVEGTKSTMTIAVKKNAVKVAHSDCPTQYCVHMDYVSEPGLPIVCAYNGISIILEGRGDSPIYVG